MAKETKIKLVGYTKDGQPATTQTSENVTMFMNSKGSIRVTKITDNFVTLITSTGTYELMKHPTINIYVGIAKGHKVHLAIKKIVGQLIYW